ncbi:MAG: hypothetical protein Q9169_006140, partial [Polycauliona sp. 2 TL-2023]
MQLPKPQSCSSLRILSHNIRYAITSPVKNERPWDERRPLIMSSLSYNTRLFTPFLHCKNQSTQAIATAPFICLQEVLHTQLSDILHDLNGLDQSTTSLTTGPNWAHIGVGREDGQTKGEYNPIIYPLRLFSLLYSRTIWLSPTPSLPSKGWDAGCERILTMGVFKSKVTGQVVIACNTHLDNIGSVSRKESVGVICHMMRELSCGWDNDGGAAMFLAGDFNSREDEDAYICMVKEGL